MQALSALARVMKSARVKRNETTSRTRLTLKRRSCLVKGASDNRTKRRKQMSYKPQHSISESFAAGTYTQTEQSRRRTASSTVDTEEGGGDETFCWLVDAAQPHQQLTNLHTSIWSMRPKLINSLQISSNRSEPSIVLSY